MNFWPFRKPDPLPHVTIRHVVATRQESLAAQRRRTSKMLELAVYVATTTPEQRAAETQEAFARIRRARDERGGE
jgi:hypothetical protein